MSGDETFNVEGQFCVEHAIAIDRVGDCSCYLFGDTFNPVNESWRIMLYADGNLLFDSGCSIGNMSTTVNIPIGTSTLRFYLKNECAYQCESGFSGACEAYFSCV